MGYYRDIIPTNNGETLCVIGYFYLLHVFIDLLWNDYSYLYDNFSDGDVVATSTRTVIVGGSRASLHAAPYLVGLTQMQG